MPPVCVPGAVTTEWAGLSFWWRGATPARAAGRAALTAIAAVLLVWLALFLASLLDVRLL